MAQDHQRSRSRFRNSCEGKKWYTTKAKADQVARGCHREFGDAVHGYKCDECGWWHVGSVRPADASIAKTPYKRHKRPLSEYLAADGY